MWSAEQTKKLKERTPTAAERARQQLEPPSNTACMTTKGFVCWFVPVSRDTANPPLAAGGLLTLAALSNLNVDCVEGYVCGNMHIVQSKACEGGLYVDHPGYSFVAQVGSRFASARCLSLGCLTTVASNRYA